MQIADTKNPSERRKLIWALVLGLIAIVFLWWTFFGFGGSSKPTNGRNGTQPAQPPPARRASAPQIPKPEELKNSAVEQLRPIIYSDYLPAVAEAQRNIFVYYEKPPPPPPSVPSPTATPTPPVLLANVSPASVYARTDDFTLEATGDKFTNEVRITIDGREFPTRFLSPQQLTATVPASVIANPGSRQVTVRSADGRLYSNPAVLAVNAPPTPNYSYIGIIGTQRRMDTAILQDKSNKEIVNAQRGDVVGGRFRLTSISEKELVLVDTNLKIRHMLQFTTERDKGLGPLGRPTPRVDSEDDEP